MGNVPMMDIRMQQLQIFQEDLIVEEKKKRKGWKKQQETILNSREF